MTNLPKDRNFRWLFDAAVDAMLIADSGGRILLVNPAFERLLGYSVAEACQLSVDDFLPERLRAAHEHYRSIYAAQPVPRPMAQGRDLRALHRDGHEMPLAISLSVLPVDETTLTLAILEDLSERQRARQDISHYADQLERNEASLGLAVRAMRLGLWQWNLRSDHVHLSAGWKEQIGFRDDELPNTVGTWLERLHPDERDWLQRVRDEYLAGDRLEADITYRLLHRDGHYRWMQLRSVLLPSPPAETELVVGIQWDVTDKMGLEKQWGEWRTQLEDLHQMHVARETASAIAHELNQPLNALVSYSEGALKLFEQGRTEKLVNALQQVTEQGKRTSVVVRDLLALLNSRDVPTETIDLNTVVSEAVDLVRADGRYEFDLRLELQPGLPTVRANKAQVRRVLINLLQNGVEAMTAGGVKADAISVTVRTAEDGSMAQVTVRDRGPGLDPKTIERLFQPFFTTKPTGIGMGLAVSRRIIERYGGRLWFDSAGTKPGAVFHFTLPFAT